MSYCSSFFFFSSRRRHTRFDCDWSSDVCSSDLVGDMVRRQIAGATALVLTKADQASAPMIGKARQRLAEIAPHTMVLTAQCGEIPLAVFLDAVPLPRQPQQIGRASCRERV